MAQGLLQDLLALCLAQESADDVQNSNDLMTQLFIL